MVARVVLTGEAAFEPAKGAVDQRRAFRALAGGDSMPVRERGYSPREVLCNSLLVSRQQAEREPARLAQELVHGRLPVDPDPDQRRLERE